jgi:hypothetical protein
MFFGCRVISKANIAPPKKRLIPKKAKNSLSGFGSSLLSLDEKPLLKISNALIQIEH